MCGSLAVDNAGDDGDVDLFLITAPRRLWLVQATTMVLRRLARRRGVPPLCPNYLLIDSDLRVGAPNLYLAHEVTQTRPLLGVAVHRAFREANRWTEDFLPQRTLDAVPMPPVTPREPSTHWLRRSLEKLLGGRMGDLLDRLVHRLLLCYYRLRLRRHGWRRADLARAYRPDRQTVMTGGYMGAVAERFLARCSEVLDDPERAGELFRRGHRSASDASEPAATADGADGGDPLYAGIFDQHYGGAR